jgi:uncharacterized OsmC-like protein
MIETSTGQAKTSSISNNKVSDEKVVNGVNVEKLYGIIGAVSHNAQIAKFNFRAKNKWIDGPHNTTVINDFDGAGQTHSRSHSFVLETDEHPVLLGTEKGPNPAEYTLTALAGCLTSTLIYHASVRGIVIDEIETSLSGDVDLRGFLGMDETIRNGYQQIQVAFKIKADAPEDKLQELVELAQQRSPVFDIISHPTPVCVTLVKQQEN